MPKEKALQEYVVYLLQNTSVKQDIVLSGFRIDIKFLLEQNPRYRYAMVYYGCGNIVHIRANTIS